ncbi:MAG TPA: hypothetical protein OIM48_01120 [Clostridiaceae bacterium]|nr:hypothetical protein [Clostridium sp.]HJJ11906.1 hypothetical protein [Clostridiaceae bacterium]
MNTKLEKLKENINNNTKETINLINTKLEKNFKELKNIELIENSQIFNGINIKTNEDMVTITICNKEEANKLGYKYWAYFCMLNNKETNISLLDEIKIESYSKEEHHDIMEISSEEKNIKIKVHYIETEELLKKELITEDELLVLIEVL